jgi:hypothetical protein
MPVDGSEGQQGAFVEVCVPGIGGQVETMPFTGKVLEQHCIDEKELAELLAECEQNVALE